MALATKPLHNRIAVVFDFDDTLAPDSYASLLDSMGLNRSSFDEEHVQPLIERGWDSILARFHSIIEASRSRDDLAVTREYLLDLGRSTEFFDGVPNLFDAVREAAHGHLPDLEVEFYLLSSGILEIAEGTSIADEFQSMWGCEFHYDESGEIAFIKRIITHPEKTRYLLQLSKGAEWEDEEPSHVYQDTPEEDLYVPLSQVIFVGDGASDMPAFRLLNEQQGIAVGIFNAASADAWRGYDDTSPHRRVQNLASADYREGSELMRTLVYAVESICKRIEMLRLSAGE